MGAGDNIMATGMARGAADRKKKIAFGDGLKIRWDQFSQKIFYRNPNIALPGQERDKNVEWIPYYKGHRLYNAMSRERWVWNYDFRPTPGQLFFAREETAFADSLGRGFIVIEPNVPAWKSVAPNKQWPVARYEEVARRLSRDGHTVVQFNYGGAHRLSSVSMVPTITLRHAIAAISRAALYIGPEGGLHHGAAAVNTPAVVLFGGFIPPQVTGYDTHTNLARGEACGSFGACSHCADAMRAISVEEVYGAATGHLEKRAA